MDIIILGAIVLGLTQVVKITFNPNIRFVPAISLTISFAVFGVLSWLGEAPFNFVLVQNAIVTGLAACGLWSGTKTTVTPNA